MPDTMPESLQQLTGKRQKFVLAYVGEARCNATRAAEIAGFKGNDAVLWNAGYRLLRDAQVKAAVRDLLAERLPDTVEVVDRLAAQARFDPADFAPCYKVDPDTGRQLIDWDQVKARGLGRLVKRVVVTRHGEHAEFHDPQKADELIGKYLSIWTDRVKIDAELDLSSLSPEQLAALAAGKRPDDV